MKAQIIHYPIEFIKPAITSRNVFNGRDLYFIVLEQNGLVGIGEAAPLEKLSIDESFEYPQKLIEAVKVLVDSNGELPYDQFSDLPSAIFGMETAMYDLRNGGERRIFNNTFFEGKPIKINGLVWMNSIPEMLKEADSKISNGFNCIKFKVGAQDFDAECRMLELIRKRWSAFALEIRLDANGAFNADDASEILKELSRFEIHSIEQPIKADQWDKMAQLCRDAKIDIALDEELIGRDVFTDSEGILKFIQPSYIILKPNLLGGFRASDKWISSAKKFNIGWWATSALESNIGLNAIAQWVSSYANALPQGLGTGGLYSNNFDCPLELNADMLRYGENKWNLNKLYKVGSQLLRYEN